MKHIGIIPNAERDSGLKYTAQIVEILEREGCVCHIFSKTAKGSALERYEADKEEILDKCEFVITLGGDGTILSSASVFAKKDIPVLGINLGHLGFLTAADKDEAESAVRQVINGNFTLEKRLMIDGRIRFGEQIKAEFVALNDICITRGTSSRLVKITVYINDEYMDSFYADGVIISTPTGSTAYNLSAGGPILKPDSDSIAITPICPHTLHTRPTVISGKDKITISVDTGNPDESCVLSADGQKALPFSANEFIRIEKSKLCASIIKTKYAGFYDILRTKLSSNGG